MLSHLFSSLHRRPTIIIEEKTHAKTTLAFFPWQAAGAAAISFTPSPLRQAISSWFALVMGSNPMDGTTRACVSARNQSYHRFRRHHHRSSFRFLHQLDTARYASLWRWILTLSPDSSTLSLMGHNVVAGSDGSLTTSYTIAQVNASRNVDVGTTTTSVAGIVPNGSVVTSNRVYAAFGAPTGPGLGTTTTGSNAALTALDATSTYLNPQVVNNQLYAIRV